MTQQVETATVVGNITGTGTATLTVTASGMSNSPKAVTANVTAGQTPAISSMVMRAALAADGDVSAFFLVGGDGVSTITLTARESRSNDTTMNLAIANGTCTGLTSAATSADTTAGAEDITNGYCTLAQLKATDRLGLSDTVSDTALTGIIEAVSREIDDECGRYFYKSSVAEIRYFTAGSYDQLYVGDFVSITTLQTDNGDRSYPYTWATTDYDLFPHNAATVSEAEPYRWIDIAPQGNYTFPKGLAKGVKLTAVYGWNAVPAAITEACLLWSMRWFKRLKTPLGISAMSALGQMSMKVPPPDPDVLAFLSAYKVVTV